MSDKKSARLGAVQETLFIPLLDRARDMRSKHSVLHDAKALKIVESVDYDYSMYAKNPGGAVTVLRTAVFDTWVRAFLAQHPDGTVIELGTGLNTRFERVDNGRVHWIDLDLPDTLELRRQFFVDTDRRHMVVGSVLAEDWFDVVAERPGPYFFVSEGVLVYLPEDEVRASLARIVQRFPGSWLALDTYHTWTLKQQNRMFEKKKVSARWSWACDDPRSLQKLGLRALTVSRVTRPPRSMRNQLPLHYRLLLPLIDQLLRRFFDITLFRTNSVDELVK